MPETGPQITSAKRTFAEALVHPGTFATTLVAMLLDEYGTEALTWAPETIRMELQDDFKVRMPDASFDRLMVGIALLTADDFYKSLPDFVQFCNVLGGSVYDPSVFDPADGEECAWGITEALLLSPPDDDDEEPFAAEIAAYIGHVLDDEGIMNPPDVLRIGVRSGNPANTVQGEFSDDPAMFSAIYGMEQSKTDEINGSIKHNLDLLIQQLETLDLANGDARELRTKLSQSIDS